MAAPRLGLSERDQRIRATGIGASEIYDVLHQPMKVYSEKVEGLPPAKPTSQMEFGSRGERILGEAYMARHANENVRIYSPGTIRHRWHAWALATPDRVVAAPGAGRPARQEWVQLLEMKWVFQSDYPEEDEADEIPERHLLQVQWALEVADMGHSTLVACVRGDYREFPIRRDKELGALLLDEIGRFWVDHIQAKRPPPPDASESWSAYLKRRHPEEKDVPLLAPTEEAIALVDGLRAAKARAKMAAESEAEAQNRLLAFIGDAPGIAGLCTWKKTASAGVDWKGVAETFKPTTDEIKPFVRPGYRTLRLQTPKGTR